MTEFTLLQFSLLSGLVLSVVLSTIILASLYINPEMWLHDAPAEVQAKHGPMSERAKRQRIWLASSIFVALIGLVAFSIVQFVALAGAQLTFLKLFAHLFIMFMLFNVVDLLLIDWLIVEWIRPGFLAGSRLGTLMGERNYWYHFQGFLKGTAGITVVSLLLAAVVIGLYHLDSETIFRLITFLVLVTAVSISVYFRHRAEREGGKLRSGEGQRLVIVLRLLGLLVLLPLFGYLINPTWVAWARFSLPETIRWMAVGVALVMLPAIYWLFRSIGNNISPTQQTRQNHQLVTHGPYRWIRHPLYTFGSILIVALTLVTGLWWIGITMLPLFAVLLWRTQFEEQRLIETFGDEYRAYMRRTGRFWPRLSDGLLT
ncbi:MAG: isoprenylcysteine carboxylmethyltransferase family protein [Caldilineaceae bacterium]